MKLKEISVQVKEDTIGRGKKTKQNKEQHKSIREMANTLGVATSIVWYILKKTERTGELNINRPVYFLNGESHIFFFKLLNFF